MLSVELALTRWFNNLLDLSRRNPLLSLPTEIAPPLEITHPEGAALFAQLMRGAMLTFGTSAAAGGTCPPPPDGLVTTSSDELQRTLATLEHHAQADLDARGLVTLYLALGTLTWRDADDQPWTAPLLLVPVTLDRLAPGMPFRLQGVADEPAVNLALTTRLAQDFDLRLPPAPVNWTETSFPAYVDEVATLCAGLPGWLVERRVYLGQFHLGEAVIDEDLRTQRDALREHPLVRALAGLPQTLPRANVPADAELDAAAHVLDADAGQRRALAAARQAESFGLVGPPGSGKSQTIANLSADRIIEGKQVLVVSEQRAALADVHERLCAAGLGDFCLELYGHEAAPRAVVAKLMRSLKERTAPPPVPAGMTDADHDRLQARRAQLDRYVEALHRRREPIGRSAWYVLAELPRWRALPRLALAASQLAETTPTRLEEITRLGQRAEKLWPVHAAAGSPWAGFKADRFTLQLRDEIAGLLDKMRPRGEKLLEAVATLSEQLDVQATARWLLKLGDLLEHRPGAVPLSWFLDDDLDRLAAEADAASDNERRPGEGRGPLSARYGPAIWQQEDGAAERLDAVGHEAAALLAPGADLLGAQQRLRGWTADTQKRLPGWVSDLRALEKWLGVTLGAGAGAAPRTAGHGEGHDPSPHGVKLLLRLSHLAHSDHPPDRKWCADPAAARSALDAVAQAKPLFAQYRQDHQQLLQTYTEQIFELDLTRIAAGYAGPYRGPLRWLSGAYRRDRRALQRRARQYELPATVAQDVVEARDVQALHARLEAEATQRWQCLGRHERGLDTDLDAAERAAKAALEAFDVARQLGLPSLPERLIEALTSGKPPEKVRASIKRLQESFGAWLHETHELQHIVPAARLPATGAALEESALSAVIDYARELQSKLNPLGAATDALVKSAPQPPTDLAALVRDLREAAAQRAAEGAAPSTSGTASSTAGDRESMRQRLGWSRRLRALWHELGDGGAVPEPLERFTAIVTGALAAPSFQELRQAHEQFLHAAHLLEHRFDAPGPRFQGRPWSALDAESIHFHAVSLRSRLGELGDAIEWRRLPDRFTELGLSEFWQALPAAVATLPPAGDGSPSDATLARSERAAIGDLLAHAFWSGWLAGIVENDEVLRTFDATEHERTAAEFGAFDRRAQTEAAARLVAQRRATSFTPDAAEVAVLTQAAESANVLPLRQLFERIPQLRAELKPCLLMNPAAVSRCLPAAEAASRFDLVVFDEALPIAPERALGALVRSAQAVIVGDAEQAAQPGATATEDGPRQRRASPSAAEETSLLDVSRAAGWRRWELSDHGAGTPAAGDPGQIHPLAEDVRQELAARGHHVIAQQRAGGGVVALAVVDPQRPQKIVLRIEFDGPEYRDAGPARDRDRLHGERAASQGWRLHRIWSLAWRQQREQEVERLSRALAPEVERAPVT